MIAPVTDIPTITQTSAFVCWMLVSPLAQNRARGWTMSLAAERSAIASSTRTTSTGWVELHISRVRTGTPGSRVEPRFSRVRT